mmetsp:Transcript_25292/g.62621  ORF Transcript_25292/g.62621 Transcript_25292/m.62621 type:complete len:191 (-) Transcript_25292:785-1357(-)
MMRTHTNDVTTMDTCVVLSNAGTAGAAATTSGLAAIGQATGLAAIGRAIGFTSMSGGVMATTFASAMLMVNAISSGVRRATDDDRTANITYVGGIGGAAAAAYGGATLVSASPAGITYGLAALGGGSIASSGAGMLAGLTVLTSGTVAIAAGASVAFWGLTEAAIYRIERDLRQDIRRLQSLGVIFPEGI